jgi:hypothetical protein
MQVLADGRVRRTAAEWRELIEAQEASGLSVLAFCERKKLSRSAFTRWRHELKRGGAEAADAEACFVELPLPGVESGPRSLAPGELELSLPSGVTLRWKP